VLNKPKTIEDHILASLQVGSRGTAELLEELQAVRAGTTKQAFYQTLRKLKKEEVVVVYAKRVSLSHIWINTMAEYFSIAGKNYSASESPSEEFLLLTDGEKISYSFKDPHTTDIFWGHAFGILLGQVNPTVPICIYNSHEWFLVAREESEKKLFTQIKDEKKSLLMLVGNREVLDIEIGKWFDGEQLQYFATTDKIFDKKNYYINVFGDFIIEAWLDPKTTIEINDFYLNKKVLSKEVKEELKNIVSKKGRNKLVISRNSRKASKTRSMFKKYFVFNKSH
jgi:hypothetical protein